MVLWLPHLYHSMHKGKKERGRGGWRDEGKGGKEGGRKEREGGGGRAKKKNFLEAISNYALNTEVPNFIKQRLMEIKCQIDPDIIIMGEFNISHIPR